jgi:hypothetical protein
MYLCSVLHTLTTVPGYDAVDVPLFGPPHPHVLQLAWNLDPPVNTDSTEAMNDMLRAHGVPVPTFLGGTADERRFSVNELMELYICHRNWQWRHDKTVWPAWAKALDSNQTRAHNSYRVTILSTLQRRYRLFLGRAVNVRFDFLPTIRAACSPYDFALLTTQHALEQRDSKNRNVTSVFEDVKDVYLLFPPTMAGRPEESDGQVHPICGHSVTTRLHTAHYDEGDRAMMGTIGDQQASAGKLQQGRVRAVGDGIVASLPEEAVSSDGAAALGRYHTRTGYTAGWWFCRGGG